ncbi:MULTISPECIES: ABC-type transport auxiliary lipoprotein family protein [Marinobacter]|jgi:cholesterol transport system auxiliary component|uniref:ABC-type transport auxiliary lipoprotein family protein n=1 Tax=Marinobacter TaxID=2742 RepID=UPI003B42D6F5|nr:ABC-type transport auxiliary lipoprotein family protein [Marinobacter alkaliphilus]
MTIGLRRLAVYISAATLTTACTVFPTPEPPRALDLAPYASEPMRETPRPVSLRIDTPLASDPLDSARVLLKPSLYEFQALPAVRWRDNIPVVVRDYLIQSFRYNGGFDNVITDTSPAFASHTLISELSAFHAENRQDQGVTVVMELHTEIMGNRTRRSLCSKSQRVEQRAESASVDALMEAFSESSRALAETTNRWAYACLAEARQRQ